MREFKVEFEIVGKNPTKKVIMEKNDLYEIIFNLTNDYTVVIKRDYGCRELLVDFLRQLVLTYHEERNIIRISPKIKFEDNSIKIWKKYFQNELKKIEEDEIIIKTRFLPFVSLILFFEVHPYRGNSISLKNIINYYLYELGEMEYETQKSINYTMMGFYFFCKDLDFNFWTPNMKLGLSFNGIAEYTKYYIRFNPNLWWEFYNKFNRGNFLLHYSEYNEAILFKYFEKKKKEEENSWG